MGWLRDILDVLVIRDEHKKRRVETRLAEHDLQAKESSITLATFEDVERFDPQVKRLHRHRTPDGGGSSGGDLIVAAFCGLALLAVLLYGLWVLIRAVYHLLT